MTIFSVERSCWEVVNLMYFISVLVIDIVNVLLRWCLILVYAKSQQENSISLLDPRLQLKGCCKFMLARSCFRSSIHLKPPQFGLRSLVFLKNWAQYTYSEFKKTGKKQNFEKIECLFAFFSKVLSLIFCENNLK